MNQLIRRIFIFVLVSAFLQVSAQPAQASSDQEFVQYLKENCEENDYEACWLYAGRLASGQGVDKNVHAAIRFYLKACENAFASACYSVGRLYTNGPNSIRNREKSLVLFMRGCQLGDEAEYSCTQASKPFRWDKLDQQKLVTLLNSKPFGFDAYGVINADPEQYVKELRHRVDRQGCLVNVDDACSSYTLEEALRATTGEGDFDQAIAMAWRGCKAGGIDSCVMGTRMLSGFFRTPKKGSTEYLSRIERTAPFLKRGCNIEEATCDFLYELKSKALK